MELNPTSNAPGPASPHAIQALPKRKLDEELLGPEGKGECTVCMDDVHTGDEVVMLPCSHWFHETGASAWLNEQNTCPTCRKGIEDTHPTAADPVGDRPHQTLEPSQGHSD
jgi:division protein 1